jgi:hypothetical protein
MWQPYAEAYLGRLAMINGQVTAGVEHMQSAIAGWQAMGMAIGLDSLVMVLTDGCLAAARRRPPGDEAARASLVATGLAAIEPLLGPDVPYGQSYQPEFHRLRGELLLEWDGLTAFDKVQTCFEQAMLIGLEQDALAWELRAAMSLVRLRMRQSETYAAKLAEARRCLRDVYMRFTEGFGFPDLQEAAALIGETGIFCDVWDGKAAQTSPYHIFYSLSANRNHQYPFSQYVPGPCSIRFVLSSCAVGSGYFGSAIAW